MENSEKNRHADIGAYRVKMRSEKELYEAQPPSSLGEGGHERRA